VRGPPGGGDEGDGGCPAELLDGLGISQGDDVIGDLGGFVNDDDQGRRRRDSSQVRLPRLAR
jgi:hypothetical protein